jgi:hypothetical protein
MPHFIPRILEPLVSLFLPAAGRHRAAGPPEGRPREDAPTLHLPRVPAAPLRGEDVALVRPYVTAHEHQREARLRRHRRRALWLAVHRIDIGPRLIHGVVVA